MNDPRRHPTYLDEIRALAREELLKRSWTEISKLLASAGVSWPDRGDLGKDKYVTRQLETAPQDQLRQLVAWFTANLAASPRAADFQDSVYWLDAGGQKRLTDVTRRLILEKLNHPDLNGQLSLREFFDLVGRRPDTFTVKFEKRNFRFYRIDLCEHAFSEQVPSDTPPTPRLVTGSDIFSEMGLMTWPDQRIIALLEALVAPTVRSPDDQTRWLDRLRPIIEPDGFCFECQEYISQRPVYRVLSRSLAGAHDRPKNVIFASNGPKPELGLSDALNNHVVILKHANHCLVYDEPIDTSGVTWGQLIAWWRRRGGASAGSDPRAELGERLLESLQSPPERMVFLTYFEATTDPKHPALFPQVYLHYDPRTMAELKGQKRLPRQRMDFLLLLPNAVRVVLEVDGQQHYSQQDGTASPSKYAEMVRADRSLRLSGYEMYRFGGHEFSSADRGRTTVKTFFRRLFLRYELGKKSA